MSEGVKTFGQEDIMSLAQANNHLAINLHQLLSRENTNVFFSPFSISVAMGMLLCAAEGETASELLRVLGYEQVGIKKEDVASIFEQQMNLLLQPNDSYTLSCANSMLSEKRFAVKDTYKNTLINSFKALALEVDFLKERDKVVNQINEWVREKTNNMISKLVQSLDPSTVLILVNAVYFKGTWMKQFKKEATIGKAFYNRGVRRREVEMMHMQDTFSFYEQENFQALQLPYVGEEIAMMIILPRLRNELILPSERHELNALEAILPSSFLQDLKRSLRKQKVDVTLPRFRLEYTKSLIPLFSELGIKRAFSDGAAFTNASDSSELVVSEILHKAVLEVNEEGSEAAAATVVAFTFGSVMTVPRFVADHPFMFVIYNTKSDLILFMGRVNEL